MADTNVQTRGRCRVRSAAYRARRFILKAARRERRQAKRIAQIAALINAPAAPEPEAAHVCSCCGEETSTGRDCCSDDFPEAGEVRETGR